MATPHGSALKTLFLVGLVAVGAALLVTASHEYSKDRIVANERERLLSSLESVLDPSLRNRGVVPTHITATDAELLGTANPIDVFVATENERPVAVIFAPMAPEGYNAPIRLLIGVDPGGELTGVRVVSHRETPGLGDAIEVRKSDWILQFEGKSLVDPPLELWAVAPDDGAFDSITGATITPRAIVKAVRNTLLYFEQHREELYAAAARAAEAPAAMEEALTDDLE